MLRRQDHAAIHEALELTGTAAFRDRRIAELSGGEQQRAWIALTLAQQTPILLLDEPTTFLDIAHQLEVLELVSQLQVERRLTVLLVLHDLNAAARFAGRVLALRDGKILADGPPPYILTPNVIAEVFGVYATVLSDPVTGAPVCLPYAVIPPHATNPGAPAARYG